jgi:hypothetical protein
LMKDSTQQSLYVHASVALPRANSHYALARAEFAGTSSIA